MRRLLQVSIVTALAAASWLLGARHEALGGKRVDTRVFELRFYYAAPGKMEAMHAGLRYPCARKGMRAALMPTIWHGAMSM